MVAHVLVPIDGSPASWSALDFAVSTFDDGTITVLHVIGPEGVDTDVNGGYFDTKAYNRAVESAETLCAEAIDRVSDDEPGSDIGLETTIETGDPARTIVSYATDHDIDHVVIGSRGRSGLSRLLLGSVAETVVRRAPVPVTVIRDERS